MRSDKRPANQLRDTTITPDYLMHAEGSVLICAGNTRVICTASVEDRVPQFLRNTSRRPTDAERRRYAEIERRRDAHAHKLGIDPTLIAACAQILAIF